MQPLSVTTKKLAGAAVVLLAFLSCETATQGAALAAERQQVVDLNGRTVIVRRMDTLPFIDNDYSRRFRFDSFSNPKLKQLRDRYQLEQVVAPGKTEFEQQVLLLDWVHKRFVKFGRPSTNVVGALEILNAIEHEHTFFCSQYAQTLVSAAASLGWVDRELALRRHQGNARDGSSEHSSTEIWSNEYRKWVMMDPTANMHVEKKGIPLNGYELRQEWFYRGGGDLEFVVGKAQKRYRKSDLPVRLAQFPGFGELTIPVDELDKYGFIGFIPNTNLMDEREDYGRMFIFKDRLCDGTQWHRRDNPSHPLTEAYFPIGQAAVSLEPERERLRVSLRTFTPNFKEYQARFDGGTWAACDKALLWHLHNGSNRLEIRTMNQFQVSGPISVIEVADWAATSSQTD